MNGRGGFAVSSLYYNGRCAQILFMRQESEDVVDSDVNHQMVSTVSLTACVTPGNNLGW